MNRNNPEGLGVEKLGAGGKLGGESPEVSLFGDSGEAFAVDAEVDDFDGAVGGERVEEVAFIVQNEARDRVCGV